MRILRWLLIIVIALAVITFGGGLVLPTEWQVERSVVVQAKSRDIHPHVSDFHNWLQWSPFEKDPAIKIEYSGPAAGKDSERSWKSAKVGNVHHLRTGG